MNKQVERYVIAFIAGIALSILAIYLELPWYVRLPCYLIMGGVIGYVWR